MIVGKAGGACSTASSDACLAWCVTISALPAPPLEKGPAGAATASTRYINANGCRSTQTTRGFKPDGVAASSDSETSESDDGTIDSTGAAKARKCKMSKKTARKNRSLGSEAKNKSGASSSSETEEGEVSDSGGGLSAPAGGGGSVDDNDSEEFNHGYDENLMGA
ncbi:RNA polymerase-associated protein RTF1 homolog [Dermacentor albipictus]|uniref:RNA polymerase-associated protein RTF1 homolog n=1 Tax=Dermacentor albipictus TaxID=60249 RepID=UPI0038FD109D